MKTASFWAEYTKLTGELSLDDTISCTLELPSCTTQIFPFTPTTNLFFSETNTMERGLELLDMATKFSEVEREWATTGI